MSFTFHFVVLLLAIVNHVFGRPDQKSVCQRNEFYDSCTSHCQSTCAEPNKRGCAFICVPGCRCNDGFLLDEDSGRCLRANECPGQQTCERNEYFTLCEALCEPTCDSPGEPSYECRRNCIVGCNCNKGLLRDEKSGRCVKPNECSRKICPKNEFYDECYSHCQPTCAKSGFQVCPTICVPGCSCNEGLMRDEESGKCVKANECPEKKGQNKACGRNEYFSLCDSHCQPTCDLPGGPSVCTKNCVAGCYCNQDLLRDEDSGRCVKPFDCPRH